MSHPSERPVDESRSTITRLPGQHFLPAWRLMQALPDDPSLEVKEHGYDVESDPDWSKLKPTRILVVDDDAAVRGLLVEVLTAAGYEVTEAKDGVDALRLTEQTSYHLILVDIVMPEKDGLETIRELRQTHPGQKLIAISGAFGGTYLRAAQVMGADATLQKPVKISELLRLTARLVDQK